MLKASGMIVLSTQICDDFCDSNCFSKFSRANCSSKIKHTFPKKHIWKRIMSLRLGRPKRNPHPNCSPFSHLHYIINHRYDTLALHYTLRGLPTTVHLQYSEGVLHPTIGQCFICRPSRALTAIHSHAGSCSLGDSSGSAMYQGSFRSRTKPQHIAASTTVAPPEVHFRYCTAPLAANSPDSPGAARFASLVFDTG